MRHLALLLALLLLLTACGGEEAPSSEATSGLPPSITPYVKPTDIEYDDGYDNHFIYPSFTDHSIPSGSYTSCYTVDDVGNVYIAGPLYSTDGKFFTAVAVYDLAGNMLAEYEIETDNSVTHLSVGGGMLYYTRMGENNDIGWDTEGFFCYNLETGEQMKLESPTNMFTRREAVLKIAYFDGKLYILGLINDYIASEFEDFQDEGRVLAAYDIERDTIEIVFEDYVEDFALTPPGTIMLRAYDPEYDLTTGVADSRFYFAELDPETTTMGDRIYQDIKDMACFATDGRGIMFVVKSGSTAMTGRVLYCSLEENMGVTEMAKRQGSVPSDSIVYCNGFTFFFNRSEHRLERFRNAAYIVFSPPIKLIGALSVNEIPRERFNLDSSILPYDEFALSVLSGGVAYDVAYVRTRSDFSANLRDKGSFYPLNGVPGVQDFLDACFPYIKDAATDKDGNLWMLPISLEIDAIIYQEENCKKAGLDFAKAETIEDIIMIVRKAAEYDLADQDYFFNQSSFAFCEKEFTQISQQQRHAGHTGVPSDGNGAERLHR